MKNIEDIRCQDIVDELCKEFGTLDKALGHPKHSMPNGMSHYEQTRNGLKILHLTRWSRNIAALDKFEALIERLDEFFIAIQYFQGIIDVQRESAPLPKEYLDRFFVLVLADSIRSSLDIYAKFIAWYFYFGNRDTVGFNYKSFIKPLESCSTTLAAQCNHLYKLDAYKSLRELRDTDKHVGFGKSTIKVTNRKGKLDILMKRSEPLDLPRRLRCACKCLFALTDLVGVTTCELSQYPLGYESDKDEIVELRPDGYYWWPKDQG